MSRHGRVLVLFDGEHYPPVVRAALDEVRAAGTHVVGAALLGGGEKLRAGEIPDLGSIPVVTGDTPLVAMLAGLDRFDPAEVLDLSDEPVLDARTRMRLAAYALARGVVYRGADFTFEPPPRLRLATKPSVAVIGAGKRTGKTAIASAAARVLAAEGRAPVIVTMGRGGPEEPELIDPGPGDPGRPTDLSLPTDLSPRGLLARADAGRHAASDHLEDALTAGVATVGTRRCGGGLAGAPASSTFARGVALANERAEPILLLEGSGSSIPPVHADATLCVVPGGADPELVCGYLGSYRLLLSDVVVITLDPVTSDPGPAEVSSAGVPSRSSVTALPPAHPLESEIRELVPGIPIVQVVLQPWPLGPIAGRSVFLATTAPGPAAARQAAHLESQHRARVVGLSSSLSDRARLAEELAAAEGRAEVLVTELKAAGVDVATRAALEFGMEVVYCDNRPETVSATGASTFDASITELADLAVARFAADEARPPDPP